MQNEITKSLPLLDENGHITEEGWAKRPYWVYEREKIKANPLRIKEWDYYLAISHKNQFGLAFTLSDMGYIGFSSILFLDFKNKFYFPVDSLFFFPVGSLNLFNDSTVNGINKYEDKKLSINVTTNKIDENIIEKKIKFNSRFMQDYYKNKGIEGQISLTFPENTDSICIATSWKENRRAFYYNQKINCMKVKGDFKIGNNYYQFDENTDLAVLDWGRGVWTYKNRWYWSSLSSYIDGKKFGWNFGYGFSDRTAASENALFYDGKIFKLDLVNFIYDNNDYMKSWKIIDNEGLVDLTFDPILDRNSRSDLIIIKSIQHQVFGLFNGKIILDGKEIVIENLLGFAEDVYNAW